MKSWERMRIIVKKRIEDEGVKQKFLAQKCGYDEKTFSLLINGKKQITDNDIEQFCYGMDVLPNTILQPKPRSEPKSLAI